MSNLKEGIRIVCDGTSKGTRVIDLATNEPISNVISVGIDIDTCGVRATLTLAVTEVDITVPPTPPSTEHETTRDITI